ncbi:16S rRNA (uracil(1498)-N(3))-methyltransferase [Mechercharimyces sp. CAU 1602]|uniref:16S rRNA (uracil(1498)-N(3))-methyltransferase n=1 Tax=Mechercharimyces sp. CAU 1602 TaxID=2973933 RepID=UPI002161B6F8|nr:16S rRNA (uracil(1498)-N(3))-methyltransferase [Mechercharimyces sp. CAU 1602]MCS1350451.1 16S rRNA (uracil(1498)-N(3))-methyltransferase [Mechercharimyces sp. CAU 1602]
MQRYFIEADSIKGNRIIITGDDVHHIRTVLRSNPGEKVLCCDSRGTDYIVHLEKFHADAIEGRIETSTPSLSEAPIHITIAQSLPKGDKMDYVVQKGTELGASAFLPFMSQRTVVKLNDKKAEKRVERWQRIAKEAAEQSHRGKIPIVHGPIPWKQLLHDQASFDHVWIAYEKGGEALTAAGRDIEHGDRLLIIIGPEGGFTDEEVSEAEEAGMTRVSLGPRILRTETAGLAVLACLMVINGEVG